MGLKPVTSKPLQPCRKSAETVLVLAAEWLKVSKHLATHERKRQVAESAKVEAGISTVPAEPSEEPRSQKSSTGRCEPQTLRTEALGEEAPK